MNKFVENIIQDKPRLILFLMFLFSVIVKSYFVIPFNGPIIFDDELFYKRNAEALLKFSYFTIHYLPLYSLFLSPALFFCKYFYEIMKLINVLISSLIIIPVWLLSKEFYSDKKSIYICLVSLLLPYHITYSKLLMSEVLFYPLFLTSIFTFYKFLISKKLKWTILAALFLGLCLLTRYMAVIMLPVYLVIFIYKAYIEGVGCYIKQRKYHLLLFVIVFLLIISAFYLPAFDYLISRSEKYAGLRSKKQDSPLFNLVMWNILYICYFIILTAPILLRFIIVVKDIIIKRNENTNKYIFLLLIIGLSLVFIFVSAKHSNKNDYTNHYILGRYIMYLFLPVMILSFDKIRSELKYKKVYFLVYISLCFFSYFVIKGDIVNVSHFFVMSHISPEAFIFKRSFIILNLFVFLISYCSIHYKKFFRISYIIFLLFSLTISNNIYANWVHTSPEISDFLYGKSDMTIYTAPNTGLSNKEIVFRYNDSNISIEKMSINDILIKRGAFDKKGYALSKGRVRGEEPLFNFNFKNNKINVYETPFEKTYDVKFPVLFNRIKINGYGIGGRNHDAISVKCTEHTVDTELYFDDSCFVNTVYNNDHVTGLIPEPFKARDSISIKLVDITHGSQSKTFIIKL